MSITTALANAITGLSVTSRSAEIVSDNIANALTPGYSRKDVEIGAQVTAGVGRGAYVAGITAAQDAGITGERRRLDAAAEEARTELSALDRISRAMGEPGDPLALAERATAFEASLAASAADPSSVQKQANVLTAATNLTSTINQISTENRRIRMDADAEIAKQVGEVNTALREIQTLNQEIKLRTISGGDASALIDQRKALIDRVSSIIPIRTGFREGGEVAIFSQNGQILLDGKAMTLGFSQSGLITSDMTLGSGALSGITVEGQAVPIGTGNGTGPLDGGSLSALFEIRDVTVPAFDGQLDALAADLIERFQDPTVDPTLMAGDAGLFTDGGIAYAPANEVALASRIAVNGAVDPAQGGELWRIRDGIGAVAQGTVGDSTLLSAAVDAVTELRTPSAALDVAQPKDFADFAAELTSQRANAAETSDLRAVNLGAQQASLVEAEAAATGVDSDRELQRLLVIEQAYAANARVITVVDRLIQRLLEL